MKITDSSIFPEEEINEYVKLKEKLSDLRSQEMELNNVQKAITQELKNQASIVDQQNDAKKEQSSIDASNITKINYLTKELHRMVEEYNNIKKANIVSSKDIAYAKIIKKDINQTIRNIEKLGGGKIKVKGINDAKKDIDSINHGLTTVVKKVGKWALAVFGVRSAYMAIRRAMSVLSQYDDQLATNIEYIEYAIAYTLKPIINWILNAVFKLLQYVNYIWKAWTGDDLFKSAKAFDDARKNAKGLNKELEKTTASFDEMNVLQDTTKSGNGLTSPDTDLIKPPSDIQIPQWIEAIKNFGLWVIQNWPTIVTILGLIGGALLIGKIGKFIKELAKAKDTAKNVGTSFTTFFDEIGKGVKAIAILGGLALVINSITYLIDTFSKRGLKLNDVIGLMGGILGTIVGLMGAVAFLGPKMTTGLVPFLGIIGGISALLIVMALTIPTILEACSKFINNVAPSIESILQTIYNGIKDIIYAMGTTLPPIIESVGDVFDTIFKGIARVIETVGNTVIDIMVTANNLVNFTLKNIIKFINELGPAINNFVDNAIIAITKLINFIVSGIEYLINTLIVDSVNGLFRGINNNKLAKKLGISIGLIPDVSIRRFTPRLAKGAIINQPGRGIPVGGAIGGERGQEGVLPLTDSQQMQLLGETIGKYITINASITNTMNGRVISRELKKINNSDEFAFNN